jgi:HD superfamily phosphodiesterase
MTAAAIEQAAVGNSELEAVLNELGYGIDGALTETGGLLHDTGRDALDTCHR